MSRLDPAVALRVPSTERRARPEAPDDDGRPRLRLVVTRGHLAVELDRSYEIGPLRVDELVVSLPDIPFPVELSGGVAAFRNRRGRLERLSVALPTARLMRWGRARLAGVLGPAPSWIAAPLEDGWLVGACDGARALAFEVMVAPLESDARLLVTGARGLGLDQPPQTLAVRALAALTKPYGKLVGGAVVLERVPLEIARAMLPLAGMRAPSADDAHWVGMAPDLAEARAVAAREQAPEAPSERAIRAVELATLVAGAEDALLAGRMDEARRGYLDALSTAPRHPEISRRLAELDLVSGDRAEAALSTLADACMPTEAGVLGAQLLAAVGDGDGAKEALRRAAEREPYGALAAICLRELSRQLDDPAAAATALDEAVARAPSLESVRWERFERRVRAGWYADAVADLEHLDAAASGASERHRIHRRAAELWWSIGAYDEAVETFERALRYLPSSVDAVSGLSRALAALGHKRRALDLASRAAALAEASGHARHGVVIELAKLLAEVADDRPMAIARVRSIPPLVAETFESRLLEARWRAEMGDLSGASDALGRLADATQAAMGVLVPEGLSPSGMAVEGDSAYAHLWSVAVGDARAPYANREEARVAIAVMLEEGAHIHEVDRGDPRSARRLVDLAIRLAPRRGSIQRAYRRLSQEAPPPRERPRRDTSPPTASSGVASTKPTVIDARTGNTFVGPAPRTEATPAPEPRGTPAPGPRGTPAPGPGGTPGWSIDRDGGSVMPESHAPPSVTMDLDASDEVLAEQLADRLRANPADHETARELAEVLERLGRDHELLALLSAGIDEGGAERRVELTKKRREVLARLVAASRAAGRHDEAELYALMLERGDE